MKIKTPHIALILVLISGCIEIEDPSNIPEIKYKNHQVSYCEDNLGNENKCIDLSFELKDGDGNMGLLDSDTTPPFTGIYKHNFYYDLWVFEDGGFQLWEDLAINYFDIPYIVPQGQNKILIADVSIDLSFSTSTLPYDTMMLSFYVYDRDLNQSNIEYTDTIIFQQNQP
ncbi:hypothetical protein L21SP5_03495 [Salinivirga cyanobacteriivorans]|uniref:Uncharacterized protein n=1 Tax=Salinivirga cyanobacteriivorans TaxID=1307839 RepID=A0A0S2I4C7_9BACT|nr:hypothetical protein [Salinivirga cyanobacteriivorans]ALO17106.1 hypothetical protein L21SP5_03495 [Salinivirga cyanobacteriivorans]